MVAARMAMDVARERYLLLAGEYRAAVRDVQLGLGCPCEGPHVNSDSTRPLPENFLVGGETADDAAFGEAPEDRADTDPGSDR